MSWYSIINSSSVEIQIPLFKNLWVDIQSWSSSVMYFIASYLKTYELIFNFLNYTFLTSISPFKNLWVDIQLETGEYVTAKTLAI